jgi:hypothetical protein
MSVHTFVLKPQPRKSTSIKAPKLNRNINNPELRASQSSENALFSPP